MESSHKTWHAGFSQHHVMLSRLRTTPASQKLTTTNLELAHFLSTTRGHHLSGHLLLMLISDGRTHRPRVPSSAVSLRSHKKAPETAPIEIRNARASVKCAAPRQAYRSALVRRRSNKDKLSSSLNRPSHCATEDKSDASMSALTCLQGRSAQSASPCVVQTWSSH